MASTDTHYRSKVGERVGCNERCNQGYLSLPRLRRALVAEAKVHYVFAES
jgi:hypothetical protein